MKNKRLLCISFIISLVDVLGYKTIFKQEPWAIGMSQVLILAMISALLHIAIYHFDPIKKTVHDYFNGADSPVNIAFFRIVFFGFLFFTMTGKQMLWYSQFPKELQFAPMGMGWLLPHLPINLTIATVAFSLFKLFCFLIMIGWMTRISTIMAAILGFYVLGIPQFYGSVSHNHHLFWFLCVFAASRCADALSIDAILKGFKRADQNLSTAIPAPAKTYALPLRFIWILMSICYFFPGFWKLWGSGTEWIFGDNLRNHMYLDWIGFDHWLPVYRIDQWPWLCRIAGASVILFESAFPFLIFKANTRYLMLFVGLSFHNMTNLLMNIGFYVLQICYVSFLNWAAIFKWCGQKLFPTSMTVLYDGSCSFCRRAVAALQACDIFQRIEYQNLDGDQSLALRQSMKLQHGDLMVDMHGVIGDKVVKGFIAYRSIAARVPIFWPLYPFLFLRPVQFLGNKIYRNVADHRACRIPAKIPVQKTSTTSDSALIVIASILIVGNVIFGFMGKGSGWPFACYPTFSEVAWDRFRTIDCQIINSDGSERIFRLQSLKSFTGSYKIVGLVSKIFSIEDDDKRNAKFRALWSVLSSSDPDLTRAQTVRFYFLENYADPAKWHLNPIEKKLAFEFEVNR